MILKIANVSKYYQMGQVTVKALENVSLEIHPGQFIVILGPSGSGKSTLLNIIGGMDYPTQGKIFLGEEEVTKFTDKELTTYRRDYVGFVFQFFNLMSYLTAKENVELATDLIKNSLDVNQILKETGLEDRMDHFPSQLSGGEQQRVAIARAVAKNPLFLLCDEPTGSLDFETGVKILSLLKRVNVSYKKTVIIITHNLAIGQMADRIIRMRSGEIVEDIINENPLAPEKVEW